MNTHTPAPWVFRKYLVSDADRALMEANGMKVPRALTNDGGVPIIGPERRVAVVDAQIDYKRGKGHEVECAERDANARLIAAAPDLLSALIELRDKVKASGHFEGREYVQLGIAINAAIDKATG
jgi:hypothetical protein